MEMELEFYPVMIEILKDVNSNENVAPYLDKELKEGNIRSIEDLSKFFADRYRDEVDKAQTLVKQL